MIKKVTMYICDICKQEVDKKNIRTDIEIPIIFHTEQNEGRSCTPYIEFNRMDICEHCLKKLTNLHAQGAQGYNVYWFENATLNAICDDANKCNDGSNLYQDDIVPVVRCKNCKYLSDEWCLIHNHGMQNDDFCNLGERKKTK